MGLRLWPRDGWRQNPLFLGRVLSSFPVRKMTVARPSPRFCSPGGYEGDCAGPEFRVGVEAVEAGEQGPCDVAGFDQAGPEFFEGFEPVFCPGGLSGIESG